MDRDSADGCSRLRFIVYPIPPRWRRLPVNDLHHPSRPGDRVPDRGGGKCLGCISDTESAEIYRIFQRFIGELDAIHAGFDIRWATEEWTLKGIPSGYIMQSTPMAISFSIPRAIRSWFPRMTTANWAAFHPARRRPCRRCSARRRDDAAVPGNAPVTSPFHFQDGKPALSHSLSALSLPPPAGRSCPWQATRSSRRSEIAEDTSGRSARPALLVLIVVNAADFI